MATDFIIPEPDVLLATTSYLIERGVLPYQFSVAAGRGIDTAGATARLQSAFSSIGHSPIFSGDGADILAISSTEWWVIECKGSGTGQPQTLRNNFDRALASVVSYFEEQPQGLAAEFASVAVHLGLAIPAIPAYLKELRRRVRSPLRKRLNLWILLYEPESKTIRAVPPQDAI